MVQREQLVRGIHVAIGVAVSQVDVIDVDNRGHVLQLAMPVRHTHRTDVVAFHEQHLDDHLAVLGEAGRVRLDFQAFLHNRGTGRLEFVAAFGLEQAQPACADIA